MNENEEEISNVDYSVWVKLPIFGRALEIPYTDFMISSLVGGHLLLLSIDWLYVWAHFTMWILCLKPECVAAWPFPHSAHRKSRMSSWTLRCSFSMSFLANDLPHLSQPWLFTPGRTRTHTHTLWTVVLCFCEYHMLLFQTCKNSSSLSLFLIHLKQVSCPCMIKND